jgi:hypothetical protein
MDDIFSFTAAGSRLPCLDDSGPVGAHLCVRPGQTRGSAPTDLCSRRVCLNFDLSPYVVNALAKQMAKVDICTRFFYSNTVYNAVKPSDGVIHVGTRT